MSEETRTNVPLADVTAEARRLLAATEREHTPRRYELPEEIGR